MSAFQQTDTGLRLAPDNSIKTAISGDNMMLVQPGQTAVGTNQATAKVIGTNVAMIEFITVAAGTGIALPLSQTGQRITISNAGANALLVYTNVGEVGAKQINATTGANGLSQAAGTTATYVCMTLGQWYRQLSA